MIKVDLKNEGILMLDNTSTEEVLALLLALKRNEEQKTMALLKIIMSGCLDDVENIQEAVGLGMEIYKFEKENEGLNTTEKIEKMLKDMFGLSLDDEDVKDITSKAQDLADSLSEKEIDIDEARLEFQDYVKEKVESDDKRVC